MAAHGANLGRARFNPSVATAASQNSFGRMAATLTLWRARAKQRAELASLSPTLRNDLGLTDADVWREARKPFWQE